MGVIQAAGGVTAGQLLEAAVDLREGVQAAMTTVNARRPQRNQASEPTAPGASIEP